MTSKDKMKKDELIAELEAAELKLETAAEEKSEVETENKSLKEQLAEAHNQLRSVSTTKSPGDNTPKQQVSESSDGKTHFVAASRRYRIPHGNGYVKFENNRFASDDPKIIETLTTHKAFKSEFWITHQPAQLAAS